jgi:twitching motility protein PilT
MTIDELLTELVRRDASDLHLKSGSAPVMRIRGDLIRVEELRVTPAEHTQLLVGILNEERRSRLDKFKEVDLSYNVPGVSRFRVNMFWQRGNLGAVFRVIPFNIRTIEELGLPEVCKRLALLPRGLILVTGPTGSGKSTSLAAMIDQINTTRRQHIMTIEDPIEYVHRDKTSIINQRELGTDTHSFSEALKHVMRQNPDVILVGEMRDLETISLAITAAETGHLVFSTLHTVDAAQTIDRIVDVFSPEQQAQIRTQLSVTLQAVISQTLLPTKDGLGRIACFEVMIATPVDPHPHSRWQNPPSVHGYPNGCRPRNADAGRQPPQAAEAGRDRLRARALQVVQHSGLPEKGFEPRNRGGSSCNPLRAS